MPRYLKQIIIASIFLLVFIAVGLSFYFIFKPKETEVTPTGGASQNIEIVSVGYVISGVNKIDLAAKIKNPNNDYGASSLRYQFSLFDSQGGDITSKDGNSYILAGQSKYLIYIGLDVQSNDVAKVTLNLSDIAWNKTDDLKDPSLVIKEKFFQSSGDRGVATNATGFLVNESNYDFNKVEIAAILFDNSNNIIGLGKTELNTIISKEKRYFEINWDKVFGARIARLEMEAYTNILNSDNILKIGGGSARFLRPDDK